jgi:hypothetical protein
LEVAVIFAVPAAIGKITPGTFGFGSTLAILLFEVPQVTVEEISLEVPSEYTPVAVRRICWPEFNVTEAFDGASVIDARETDVVKFTEFDQTPPWSTCTVPDCAPAATVATTCVSDQLTTTP